MVKTKSGYEIFFDRGKFDNYCVFLSNGESKEAPLDKDYFTWLLNLSKSYGVEFVYEDFLTVYNSTQYMEDEEKIYEICCDIDKHYDEDTVHWWLIYVFTMYAEEMKANTKLGKRIKHLAVYNILFEDYEVNRAANYMRGKSWRYLDKLMKERGI